MSTEGIVGGRLPSLGGQRGTARPLSAAPAAGRMQVRPELPLPTRHALALALGALDTTKLFALLDSAPSPTARHALLQTVACVLYQGEVVWCRHVGRAATHQLWESFLSMHGGTSSARATPGTTAAEFMMEWPGNVWEHVLQHLQDPCVISGRVLGSFHERPGKSRFRELLWQCCPALAACGRAASARRNFGKCLRRANGLNGPAWPRFAMMMRTL
eukprot:g8617.t1